MIISKVKRLPVEERFLYWIKERESIRLKKEAGKPKPWTDDGILQNYRFCNVRRMDDKVSRWLMNSWYKPNYDHENMLLAVGLARHFNLPRTLEAIGFPDEWVPDLVVERVAKLRNQKLPVFNAAYVIAATGGRGSDKVETVVKGVVDPLRDLDYSGDSLQELWLELLSLNGLGTFMAGQIVADLRWAVKGDWSDRMSWAPIGPGSRRGMNRYHHRAPEYNLSQSKFLCELRDVIKEVKHSLPDLSKRLEAHDIQNCFCEFSKYEKTLSGEGKPKQRYDGVC